MVDASLASFVIYVKVLKIVVEINATGTQVSTKESSVSSEDGGHVNVSLSAQRNRKTGLPFVEMSDNSLLSLVLGELAKEPCDEVAKDDGFIGFVVVLRSGNARQVP